MAEDVNKIIFWLEVAKTNMHLHVKVLKSRALFLLILTDNFWKLFGNSDHSDL